MLFGFDFLHRHRLRLLGLVLIIMTIGTYWSVSRNNFIQYDDPYYVTHNPAVKKGLTTEGLSWAFSTIYVSNWHPLTWISHMLDCQMYGVNPSGHHLTNLFLHVANALLLFLFLHEVTGHLWRSFIVSGLFALHPLHVESVAWVAERKDVLSAFFWLLALVAYGRYAKKGSITLYIGSLILFGMGLMAKPMIVTLPFVLFLLDYWPLNRYGNHTGNEPVSLQRIIGEKIPFLALSVASSMVTYMAQTQSGALGSFDSFPFVSRCLNAVVSYMRYLYKTFWPKDLVVFYPHPGDALGWFDGISAVCLLLVFSVLAIYLIRSHPYFFVGWFWFVGTLIPVIGLVQVGLQGLADRYTYIPHMGLFIAVVWGSAELFKFYRVDRRIITFLWSAVFCLLIMTTWTQVQLWRSTTTLFEHALGKNPDNYAAHFIIAREEGRRGDMEKAFDHYDKAVDINPAFVAMMHNREGYHLYTQGQLELARIQFEGALNIRSDYAQAHNNFGTILAKMGDPDQAIAHFVKALELAPDYKQAEKNLDNARRQKQILSATEPNG